MLIYLEKFLHKHSNPFDASIVPSIDLWCFALVAGDEMMNVIVLPVAHLDGGIFAFCRVTVGRLHSFIEGHFKIQADAVSVYRFDLEDMLVNITVHKTHDSVQQ